jgi:uncharacterized membrane protein
MKVAEVVIAASAVDEKWLDAVAVEVTSLHVFVHDTDDNPLVAVSATLNGYGTASGLDGKFSFLDIEPGDYTLTCTKDGYKEYSKSINLAGGRKDLEIKMLREDESWWAGLEMWQQFAIIVSAAGGGIGLLALAFKGKGL